MNKKMKQKKVLQLTIDMIMVIIFIVFDQITKYMAVFYLKEQEPYVILDGVLEFRYLENRGAAFGMLQNQKIFFVFVAVVILTVIAYILIKVPMQKKYRPLHILLVLVAAGAIGNMIDRLRLEYVVDFIYFVLINFPIFNVADIYVVVATTILVILFLFVYKESDLEFFKVEIKKEQGFKK